MAKKAVTSTDVLTGQFPPGPPLELVPGEAEHREFPRTNLEVRFSLWIGPDTARRFAATLRSSNLSISGVFLESTFFLPLGTEVELSFDLEEGAQPVQARAQIVRDQREEGGPDTLGFGLRFVEFYHQTEVTLAKLFWRGELEVFAADYLGSRRAKGLPSELARVVDALAAWELMKVTSEDETWRPVRRISEASSRR